jgi:predicted nucleic acid-binding protein
MVIVDSSVWIDAFNGVTNRHTVWLKESLGKQEIGLLTLILCEILQGIRSNESFRGIQEDLLNFPVFVTPDRGIAIASAANFRVLRSSGFTVCNSIDCMIATFCIENGFKLLQNDRDYEPFIRHLDLGIIDPPPCL